MPPFYGRHFLQSHEPYGQWFIAPLQKFFLEYSAQQVAPFVTLSLNTTCNRTFCGIKNKASIERETHNNILNFRYNTICR